MSDGRQHHLGQAQRQRVGDVERQVGAHRAAEREQAVDAALGTQLHRQGSGALRHQRHRAVLVATGEHLVERQAGGGSDFAVADLRHHRATAQHADVHHHRLAASLHDVLGQEGDLVALGVGGADDQDARRHTHDEASTAANEVSSVSTRKSTSSRVITSGGERIMFGPLMRTIRPRR